MQRSAQILSVLVLMQGLLSVQAQESLTNPFIQIDPQEVRLPSTWSPWDASLQGRWRSGAFWSGFKSAHPRWQVQFHPANGSIHRAYGPAIPNDDPTAWLEALVSEAGWTVEMGDWSDAPMGKHTLYRAIQTAAGRPVLGTEFIVKMADQGVVMWAAQCHRDAAWPAELPFIDDEQVAQAAAEGLLLEQMEISFGEEVLVPVMRHQDEQKRFEYRPTRVVFVSGQSVDGIPVRYLTRVDLETGEVLERQNTVRHIDPAHGGPGRPKPKPMGPPALMQMLSCQVTGTVHLTQPFEESVEVGLDHLLVQTSEGIMTTSGGGMLTLSGAPPQSLGLQLQGLWSVVSTNGVTPDLDAVLAGDSTVSLDGVANIRELSAYHSVNRIHAHMQQWMPDFDGLDFAIPTIVDVSGTCNAFYTPGTPSISFYSAGDGCNAFSLVSDVVFHEYGHGINDLYYESLGSNFSNGAMNEGYADWWAISLTGNPILGNGCYSENPEFYIRRYDENPKVYPLDLVGQVHADGEIICGAWYDTHLLMGGDWAQSMGLFMDTYAGQQANTQNGNEGEAFVEVLLDALQADDDNADLSDGTPNGAAILEGFGIHGITLFSNVDIGHEADGYAVAGDPISLEANAMILFPYSQYFSSCDVYYRTSPFDPWASMPMEQTGGDSYTAQLPAQETGTVVEYHFGISDIYGAVSAVTPYSSNDPANPNLPFNTIVGLSPVLIDDQDDYSDFGFWDIGLPEDNATTGEWESAIPIGSFSTPGDPSSICAPDEDHTPGDGIFAFITGVSPGQDAGIGANDVDQGSTTLQSEPIDLSGMVAPVLSYWRWYVNAPATGANPGADWWQVHVSSDGGANWVEVEETLTQDISWRRNAFAIESYVPLTDAFKIRFTASDSLRPDQGLEFDGGSLIEAAVDDLIIHDIATSGVEEDASDAGIIAWPVPFSNRLHTVGWAPGARVHLMDALGRPIGTRQADERGEVHWSLESGATGTYILTGPGRDGRIRHKEVVRTLR